MKYPVGLVSPDGEVASYGELRSYLRAVRYDTAKRWASRKSREELEHIVAAMFARNMRWAGIPSRNEKHSRRIAFQQAMAQKRALEAAPSEARKAVATKAVQAKLANDTKQAAKAKAKELWRDWQAGRTLHKGQAAFARYVVQCLPVIESTESVNRWVRQWRKEAGK